ncbi:TatD family hydrolase [Pelagibaculum spongiae]|uniref:Uncharacterized protein n=1 Tax=Pelagibaculum spongiae TaxID=2080658 RepID=A0A2V1GYN4_9GAMM|nr:TatD family hydrolase [Pelagibaculum spongiae]PVZ69755.1 hypothetical protein DC094_10685 [Pelagibaculum spongiae]
MPIEFFDSHNHLDFICFNKERRQLVDNCYARGILFQLISGVKPASWVNQLNIARNYQLYAALGFHPYFLDQANENDWLILQQLITNDHKLPRQTIIAIGECGLDFWDKQTDRHKQILFFQRQIDLAKSNQMPLILHCRKAWDEITSQLVKKDFHHGGIAHAFAGSLQQAHKLLDLGFKLGFGGAVTHPRANRLRTLLKQLPDHAIVLETDAPDMRPAFINNLDTTPNNSPLYLPEIAAVIAAIRQQPLAELAENCLQNTQSALKLQLPS